MHHINIKFLYNHIYYFQLKIPDRFFFYHLSNNYKVSDIESEEYATIEFYASQGYEEGKIYYCDAVYTEE